jgi:hypothetical protein
MFGPYIVHFKPIVGPILALIADTSHKVADVKLPAKITNAGQKIPDAQVPIIVANAGYCG